MQVAPSVSTCRTPTVITRSLNWKAISAPHDFPGQEDAQLESEQLPRAGQPPRSPQGRRRGCRAVRHGGPDGRPHDERPDRLPRASRARTGRVRRQGGRLPAELRLSGHDFDHRLPADAARRWWSTMPKRMPASSTACACTRASVSYTATTTWSRCACNCSMPPTWPKSRTAAYS